MNTNKLIDKFIDDVCAGKHNETAAAYRSKLRRLDQFLKGRAITEKTINAFKLDLLNRKEHMKGRQCIPGGLSLYTIKTVLQTTRHFCRWLYEAGYLGEDFYRRIKLPRPPAKAPDAVRADIIPRLMQAAKTHGDKFAQVRNTAILFSIRDTGARIGGLINAKVQGVDLRRGVIETTEKGKDVVLFINPQTITILAAWLEIRPKLSPLTDALFISFRTRAGLTRNGMSRLFECFSQWAGLDERVNPHSFRHAFARDFLLDGGELSQLAGLMHHSSIWVTSTYYARWDTAELKTAHEKHSPIIHDIVTE